MAEGSHTIRRRPRAAGLVKVFITGGAGYVEWRVQGKIEKSRRTVSKGRSAETPNKIREGGKQRLELHI